MTIFQAVILGIVQGLTEFIPVSSSGHVDIVPVLLGWPKPDTMFILFVHLGTLLALIAYFRRILWRYILAIWAWVRNRDMMEKQQQADFRVALLVVLGAIPAGIVGILAKGVIEQFYDSGANTNQELVQLSIIISMAVVGFIFLFNDKLFTGKKIPTKKLNPWAAGLIGASQALAFVRGVSRSGITLISGQLAGLSKLSAAEFSFLLSIPLLAAASVLGLYDAVNLPPEIRTQQIEIAAAGLVSAGVSGYLAVRFMMNYLQKNGLAVFGVYRIIFAFVVLMLLFF